MSSVIGSVDKAMILLSRIKRHGWLSVAEAAELINSAPSTAQRILATMRDRGFLIQSSGRRYGPGPELRLSAVVHPKVSAMKSVAAPLLKELTMSTGETTNLVLLEDRQVLYLDTYDSPHPYRLSSMTGSRMPAHCSAGGKAQLAALSREEVRRIYSDGVPPWPFSKIHTLEELEAELEITRKRGYAASRGETEGNVISVAAPILDEDGYPLAGMTIAVPGVRFKDLDEGELAAAVTKMADKTARLLHDGPAPPIANGNSNE